MSRLGKKRIKLPNGVQVQFDGQLVEVKGPKGTLKRQTFGRIKLLQEKDELEVLAADCEGSGAYWGLYRALIANMVQGVSAGFSQALEIQGTGYRANMNGNILNLTVGFSHPVNIEPPAGVVFDVDKSGKVVVSGIDKEIVGQMAATIRRVRPAEPYQGKGIRYAGEIIKTKVGKSAGKK